MKNPDADTTASGNAERVSPNGTRPGSTSSANGGKVNSAPVVLPEPNQPAAAHAASGSAQRTPPSLDLASLQERLKDTRAIGLFTKLSLKNQVDDLLGQFRAFHARKVPPLSELRQRYDLLLLKVLSLLQDGDPSLAAQISSSREALWDILTDPAKFAKL